MNPTVFVTGFSMGLSLIVAIGAQNAFVLRQGLRNQHVLAVCLVCALSDALLILIGVTAFAQIAAVLPWLDPVMRYGGAAFLLWYGFRSAQSAFASTGALSAGRGRSSAWAARFSPASRSPGSIRMSISTRSCCSARSRPAFPVPNIPSPPGP